MGAPFLRELYPSPKTRWGPLPEAPEVDAVLDFGSIELEREAALEGCALFDASHRGQIEVRGPDSADFLHRILANEVRALGPGEGNENLALTPKGRVLHAFHLGRTERGFELSVPAGDTKRLLSSLDRFLFAEQVELQDLSDSHGALELTGPRAPSVLEKALGAPLGEPAHSWRTTVAGSWGYRVIARREDLGALWESCVTAGAVPAGVEAREVLRIEAGSARFGLDVDDSVYPQEARLEDHFHLRKGCYVGQEVVLKIETYSGLKRRLIGLRVNHDRPVAPGSTLHESSERSVGRVTSWCFSRALGSGLVLALVRVGRQSPGTRFQILDDQAAPLGEAEVVRLPVRPGAKPPTGVQEE